MWLRLASVAAGLVLLGIAVLAWRLRTSTADGYTATWQTLSGRSADSPAADAHRSAGVYGVIVLSALLGVALLVTAAVR